ncbi:MAG: glycosyltransferase family 9 protein [Candidatus Poribacteria bacterium]|nr:glycosyltransferase family 9 protein [Candidatus Poribacteria bacterium]
MKAWAHTTWAIIPQMRMRRNWRQELTDPIYWLKRLGRVSFTCLQTVLFGSLSHLLFFRYRQFDASSIRKILLIRLDRIGDMVLTTPIIQALKTGFPQATLAVLANTYNASIVQNSPFVDRLSILPEKDCHRKEFMLKLYEEQFDLIFDPLLSPDLSAALFAFRLRGKYRIGFAFAGRELFFNLRGPKVRGKKHLLEHHEDLLQAVGLSAKEILPKIHLTPEELDEADLVFQEKQINPNRPRIAIHPGGFYPSQRWFPDRFAAVAEELAISHNAQILLFGGKADGQALDQIQSTVTAPATIMPDLGLRGFMAALSRCDLLLCNNSGPLHIASALGVPTVSTMGPTVPHLWWPVGESHTVLRKNLPCSPCQRGKCKWHDCMKLITTAEMLNAAEAQIFRSNTG